jgi:hypothetical protein
VGIIKIIFMINQLKKFGKDITPHYMWIWEGDEIIIPFAIKKVAEECMKELSNEFVLLSFELKEVPNGWDIVVTEK